MTKTLSSPSRPPAHQNLPVSEEKPVEISSWAGCFFVVLLDNRGLD